MEKHQAHVGIEHFITDADMETTNQGNRSQSQGMTCPHEEVGRHNMGAQVL